MAELIHESFTFNKGSLGIALDKFDQNVHDFVMTELNDAAGRGEVEMKLLHPWTNRTGKAEAGLWAEVPDTQLGDNYKLYMGHGVEYGIYLEKSNDAKFQILMPTLVATANAFMESLIGMLEHLDSPVPVSAIAPDVNPRRGTSQGALEHAQYVKGSIEKLAKKARKARIYFRDARGRFISTNNFTPHTPKTPRTRRR